MSEAAFTGYKTDKHFPIEEVNCHLTQLTHVQSGARVLHIGNDDPENVFCLAFRTFPSSSNGIAHILEHTVLCGSKRYPVRDPFFGMQRRSLNTFMNAMTGDDITFYPAASTVPKDFYNLLDVYLDAVFFPTLSELSFLQEGHRLEFARPMDPHSPLHRKGIVYNEMKGALVSADSRTWYKLVETLYPDTPYRFNSGGDPFVISALTHEELVAFHKTYYHPSRCLFYFYGNLPLEEHLKFINDRALVDTHPSESAPSLPKQPRFESPVRAAGSYPIARAEEMGDKAICCFGWLTCNVLEPQEILALTTLEILLMGTDAAPLKQVLLKSGLCKEAHMVLGADMLDVPLVLTIKGCRQETADAIEKAVWTALRELAKMQMPKERIDAAIHQLEFGRSEITGDSSPYGLTLFRRSAPLLLHGGNPEDGLMIHKLFGALRAEFEDPSYFGKLIYKYLLDNQHWCRVLMTPDAEVAQREELQEYATLQRLKEELSNKETKKIFKQTQSLLSLQREEAQFDLLPTVALEDIDPQVRDYPLKQGTLEPLTIDHHACFTNRIVYATLHFDLPHIRAEDLPFARLFYSILPEVGSGGRDYKEALNYLLENTGGVYSGCSLHPQATCVETLRPTFSIGGKALHRKAQHLFPLLRDILTSCEVTDKERIRELILQHHSSLEHSIKQNALSFATALAGGQFSSAGRIANGWRGLDYLFAIRNVANDLETQLDPLIERFVRFKEELLALSQAHLVLSCDDHMFEELQRNAFYGLAELAMAPIEPFISPVEAETIPSQGRVIASPVAFTCQMIPSIPYDHEDSPALTLASALFDHKTLHQRIREEGGAYGAGAVNNPLGGHFFFYAFRDPHLVATLQAFEDSATGIGAQSFSERELEEAKFAIIQRMDAPISPGSRASLAYSWLRDGKPRELRQSYRDRLLTCGRNAVARAVAKHIVPKLLVPALKESVTVTFASQEFLTQENGRLERLGKDPLAILPV